MSLTKQGRFCSQPFKLLVLSDLVFSSSSKGFLWQDIRTFLKLKHANTLTLSFGVLDLLKGEISSHFQLGYPPFSILWQGSHADCTCPFCILQETGQFRLFDFFPIDLFIPLITLIHLYYHKHLFLISVKKNQDGTTILIYWGQP